MVKDYDVSNNSRKKIKLFFMSIFVDKKNILSCGGNIAEY